MPRIKGPPEGKSPARDESTTTVEPITLDAFLKVFKESLEIQNERFDKLIQEWTSSTKGTRIKIGASKNRISALSIANSSFKDGLRSPVEMKDLRRNCKTGVLPGQQARFEGEGAYSEDSGESEDDSSADGEKRVALSGKREKQTNWFNEHA